MTTQSLNNNRLSFENVGALSHLVEAASTLTELEVEPSERDHRTQLVSDDDEISRATAEANDNTIVMSCAKKKEIFPQKLMDILADSSLSEIVCWLPHNQSFVIIRPDLFCEQVLPRYQQPATKYPSFTRKLNRWGFRQATRGADTGAFHHPFFRRDQPELCARMVCQKSRNRQQGMQKQQRRLPPKKRAINETFTSSPVTITSPVSCVDAPATPCGDYRQNPPASVSADDRSIGNSSTTSYASSFSNAVAFNSNSNGNYNNKFIASVKARPVTGISLPSATTTVPVATVTTTQTMTMNSSTTNTGGSRGILPFISNDSQFVASTLRQRETLEVLRAAKAVLYDAYMKALNEQQTTT